jgi:radical SAM protein with 4Fe4S-binding SPASM domain
MERKLLEVAYEITYRCNLRCSHCYNSHKVRTPEQEMDTVEAYKAVKTVHDFGATKLKIGGGEPLLRTDLFNIMDYARNLGLEVNFSTNGIMVRERINEIAERGIDKVQVSIDGLKASHDTLRNMPGLFTIAEEAIDELQDKGIKVNIATTLTKANHSHLYELLGFCREKGAYRWKVMKYIPKNPEDPLLLSKQEYRDSVTKLLKFKQECDKSPEIIIAREFDLIHMPRDYNDMECFGGKSFFSLKPDGTVTPCSYITDIVCGNITKESIDTIWSSRKMLEFSRDYHDECVHSEKCRGGCKAISYFLNKSYGCDPYCWAKPE